MGTESYAKGNFGTTPLAVSEHWPFAYNVHVSSPRVASSPMATTLANQDWVAVESLVSAALALPLSSQSTDPALPQITLTFAQTLDGKIAGRQGKPMLLSGPQSMAMTHRLRCLHDGILVGVQTVINDDPRLTAGRHCDPAKRQALESAGARVIVLPESDTSSRTDRSRLDIHPLLSQLRCAGLKRIMIEGGATMVDMTSVEVRRKRWQHYLQDLPPKAVKDSRQARKLVRQGIPEDMRPQVWQFLAEVDQLRRPNVYATLTQKERMPIYDVIERDVPRCYPHDPMFSDNQGSGQHQLDQVLKAYAQYNPE
ncbi:2,5-diamino-6-(ribosylamino)-4(3H)-pyrimidinone 5'-phosphate reductase, partial [Dimargaris verticillata]